MVVVVLPDTTGVIRPDLTSELRRISWCNAATIARIADSPHRGRRRPDSPKTLAISTVVD